MVRKILIIFSFLFLLAAFHNVGTVYAKRDIISSYDVTYRVNEDASTHVTFLVTLTNESSQSYASSYKLLLGFSNMSNIKASDPIGSLIPTIIEDSKGKTVQLDFNKHVVGVGKQLIFTLSFDTTDVAQKEGQILEVNIPGIANASQFENFNVHLIVPPEFKQPTYIKPNIAFSTFDFTKTQLGTSGISLAFGKQQEFVFSLTYHLQNNNIFPHTQSIALPPDTNYQKITIGSINPQPESVTKDIDGNWIATFNLNGVGTKTILVKGKAFITLRPKNEQITDQQKLLYTQNQQYWETQTPQIQQIARSLKTPKAIYDYVVKTLHYDFSRVVDSKNRLGAASLISDPSSAVCLEFSDLFIAIARANGIPARELSGYAYTQNTKERPLSLVKDILHAWPEYYDFSKKTWIMVDPTWGNTTGGIDYFDTLDFDHFVFAIQGASSTYPIPAGGYKTEASKNVKDVSVSFGNDVQNNNFTQSVEVKMPAHAYAGLPLFGTVTIKNDGGVSMPAQNISILSNKIDQKGQPVSYREILPFGYETEQFLLPQTSLLTNESDTLTIKSYNESVRLQFNVSPIPLSFLAIGGIFVAIFSTAILIITKRTWRISLFK